MKANNFKLFMGCLGNGTTVCNSAVYENGDYKTIAHISNAGNIKLYVDPDYIPADDMKRIEAAAARDREAMKANLESRLNYSKNSKLGAKIAEIYENNERGRILDEFSRHLPWAVFDEFWKKYKSKTSTEEQNKVIIEYYLKHF